MKILIVDDHPLVRKGLLATLSFEENIEKIQEASNVEEAINLLERDELDLAMVDLQLGKEDGLEIVKRAKKKNIKTKFVILTSSMRKEDFLRSQKTSIDGYILKEAFAEDILYALRVVMRGKKFFSPEIVEYTAKKEDNQLDQLTPREKDVFVELSKGESNLEIAKHLFISEHTVRKHVSNILSKLELTHRTQAALLANNLIKV
ncbi:MAG: response regulator transcription factor [Marinisporobacter sp.]|nr:response regulator transcription factor [Marinisporobacter sp.]